jgi:DivIVA domain-containing protein
MSGDGYYRARRISPEQIRSATFSRTTFGRRGISEDEVLRFLHRVAGDVNGLEDELAMARAENARLKDALRQWQSQQRDPHAQPTTEVSPEAITILSRAQRQIDAQVAEAEHYCRLREREARQRYDEIVLRAKQHAKEEAERVARAYRVSAGGGYSSDGERAERSAVWVNALLRSLDALAAHVDATRRAFAVEVEKLTVPTDAAWGTGDPALTHGTVRAQATYRPGP